MSDESSPADEWSPPSRSKGQEGFELEGKSDSARASLRLPGDDAERELPPVEPPSAGFIVQLFVVPAIIVTVVLGIWLLFGRLAGGDLDWRRAVANIRSENPQVRWRAAMTLAEMLDADQARGSDGQQLAENTEIARAITEIYQGFLTLPQLTEDQREQAEFLSKAMGRLNAPAVVFPVLVSALRHGDPDLQRQALVSASMIAGKTSERGEVFRDPAIIAQALELSYSDEPLVRQSAVFLLGLVDPQAAGERLTTLLNHGDASTRMNAAIGLARGHSTAGLPIFEQVVEDAIHDPPRNPGRSATAEEQQPYVQQLIVLTNAIKAVDWLNEDLTEQERADWSERLRRLADVCDNQVLRMQALQTIQEL